MKAGVAGLCIAFVLAAGGCAGSREREVPPLRFLLVGQPATYHPVLAPKYPVANRLFRDACALYPNTAYAPAWDWTSVHGKYFPIMKDRQGVSGRVKFPNDPVHHTAFGGLVLADLFLDFIRDDCGLDLAVRR